MFVWPSGRVQKLSVGFFSKTMVPNQSKLGRIITTVELYAAIPLLVIFDLYLGHRSLTTLGHDFLKREREG